MRDIAFELRSHVARPRIYIGPPSDEVELGNRPTHEWGFTPASSTAIRKSPGYKVDTFSELVSRVAQLAVANPRLYPLFRGQAVDHLNTAGASMLYPSIFRVPIGKARLSRKAISDRFKFLNTAISALKRHMSPQPWQAPLAAHREYWIALLQHYGLAATPLLDVTQSLRMAATFALSDAGTWATRREGFVYVFGLPHAPACLAHLVDEQMVIVRLQSVCPPDALRPHFQEGFLIGRWPLSLQKLKGDNAAYRLIGKYRLHNPNGNFWDTGFEAIPRTAVYPTVDAFSFDVQHALADVLAQRPE